MFIFPIVKITVICIGKLKEPFFREAYYEYLSRIRRFVNIDVLELEDEKKLNRFINNKDLLIVLDEKGEEIDSIGFSNLLKEMIFSNKNINFIIGGWSGLSENIKKVADKILSLSRLTFPYQLARIILLEQIYRAFTIIEGTDYHKL